MSYIFLGLGNKGEEYKNTRHNAGKIVLEYFAEEQKADWKMDKILLAQKAKVNIVGEPVILLSPELFMNVSGKVVSPLKLSAKKIEQLVVIHDDVDLPVGAFKLSFDRGSAGHKGVESIKRALKTERFLRVRVGVCPTTPSGKMKKPTGDAFIDFIVGNFKKDELEKIKKVSKEISSALELLVKEGREKAMNQFN